jgi:dipeptidyl aminopeptidase/acylaminoacyl peptidase
VVAVAAATDRPPEVIGWTRGGEPQRLTRENDALLAEVQLAEVERITFPSSDGTEVQGFVTKPPGFEERTRYPTILWIHGGPVSQFSTSFQSTWQLFAANGYLVVAANPRGSSGRGEAFSHAIWADWGNLDYEDVNAAVDHVIGLGWADPDRLGVGGWSYGGILTNYVITKTTRFHAAVSGASETEYRAAYGNDHYQLEWELELGLPWENSELYNRLSPISRVHHVTTPTLVLCGENDWNVPLSQSENLYQSLRRLGVPTELIIYPGQSHGIRLPSFQKDRYERYLAWFDRFLKPETSSTDQNSR